MNQTISFQLKSPYLIFLGDVTEMIYAKTGAGIAEWCPETVVGQLRMEGCKLDLGLPDMDIAQAIEAGARSLVIGVAPAGGSSGDTWVPLLNQAAAMGLDIVSGLHSDLADIPGLTENARKSGAALINVRRAPANIPVATGSKRRGRRLLTVGTDCAVGKKYSALALTAAMNARGVNATFRATGQTGIMIAGGGIPVDSVVSDFVSGAAEMISPENHPQHWDIIEGQGSLFNPSFSGVSLGLLHGSQPDALVICHDPLRSRVSTCPDYRPPSIGVCMELNLRCARITNPDAVCVGVCVNTSGLPVSERQEYLQTLSAEVNLPCVDPVLDGCDPIVDEILKRLGN
ncbi:DUF1611 domain-containing protein [Microbulbifer taiwanensis]|uniref:DUF1611 domain-containing protein n=1 Tax=Microbulbifer taiwanensis TaxID=986746 RepID=A0ABW1YIW6_9GAMM|nr:DUF1611 domain-containing protein [Microbulbifer taiwanensis]